ncbi:helix-turn-helix domain-containing protein [Enterococcus sp. DIV1420a]|uniref:helix-turn-helix domain-containing protein n=1 Tax=Enterococcus sp. DIV1420a TaxID=2774672 RepID=UPI003F2720E6
MLIFTLDKILAEKGLSINKLSEQTGISRQALTKIANNQSRMVKLETIETLARHLDIYYGELFYEINDPGNITIFHIEKNGFNGSYLFEISIDNGVDYTYKENIVIDYVLKVANDTTAGLHFIPRNIEDNSYYYKFENLHYTEEKRIIKLCAHQFIESLTEQELHELKKFTYLYIDFESLFSFSRRLVSGFEYYDEPLGDYELNDRYYSIVPDFSDTERLSNEPSFTIKAVFS